MKVYLAGGMKSTWQDEVILWLPDGVKVYDPRHHGLSSPSEYTRWDLDHIEKSDAVISQMSSDNPSGFGLSVEIGFAHALGKRIIFIDKIEDDWRSRYFDMHRQIAIVVKDARAAAMALAA